MKDEEIRAAAIQAAVARAHGHAVSNEFIFECADQYVKYIKTGEKPPKR